METTLFISRIYGLTILVVGLGMVLNSAYYKKAIKDMLEDTGLYYLAGIMALVIGIVLVTLHNYWTGILEIVVTILGWIGLLKGLMLILLPEQMKKTAKGMFKDEKKIVTMGSFAVIVGLAIIILGMFA